MKNEIIIYCNYKCIRSAYPANKLRDNKFSGLKTSIQGNPN